MNLIRLSAIVDLLRKGEELSNKEAWKTGQITVTAIAGLAVAVANVASAYGRALPADITPDVVNMVAAAVVSAVNIVLTILTSKTVGVLPAKE